MRQRIIGCLLVVISVTVSGCGYNCSNNKKPHCDDQVPTEACQAQFQRWFYNAATNQCQQVSYTGCSAYGFDSKSDCEKCQCH